MPKRKQDTRDVNDMGSIANAKFNPWASSDKVSDVNLKLSPLGDIHAGDTFDQGSMIALYNNDTVIHFAASNSGPSMPTAPTSGANGIILPPGQYFIYQMGDDQNLILDAAAAGKVFAYEVLDRTLYSSDAAQPNYP